MVAGLSRRCSGWCRETRRVFVDDLVDRERRPHCLLRRLNGLVDRALGHAHAEHDPLAGAVTRAISRCRRGVWAKIAPNTESARSAAPFSIGSESARPEERVTSTFGAADCVRGLEQPRGGIDGDNAAPRPAATSAALPVPHLTSTTNSLATGAARSTAMCAAGSSCDAVCSWLPSFPIHGAHLTILNVVFRAVPLTPDALVGVARSR
jgi:hypothetical protein